ncbi:glucose-6-phosphate dehydrogenase assembly protein OpcA [Gordonia sp. HY285]|uniref:Glucose-6-phosphate dehydrogenase assembly protein OpcA n=1 Tax=Gordonia liuliyuniae TaxID=2911517 RepID=A0ABS9IQZ9_9ACTN|nr:glucose-6-phosphate dehydrogenase assembly protein OpcA [Gordonia liuliyuniae]MCF8587973.1 glucose-6-phosphate dehydrogenase assembly protein OpcA [Gordonia liuliyuniae]MCF8610669.1 glucose-6-phosphate dehydrogenase assembly protein OpcA [Gordonia liuliyuniae]
MIVDLPDTDTTAISKKLVRMRSSGGAVTLGRVLTLIIDVDAGEATEEAVEASNRASREHPCRVIVVSRGNRTGDARLDAQIRVGGDAGASEVVLLTLSGQLAEHPHAVVTPFLLPDTPVVTWWPDRAPKNPAQDRLGRLASRRITDARKSADPAAFLAERRAGYSPGDTDLAWSALTPTRALFVSALDRPPHTPITGAEITGPLDMPGLDLFAGWLAAALQTRVVRRPGSLAARLFRSDSTLSMSVNDDGVSGTVASTGHPDGRVAYARRTTAECLAEELRSLDADEVYEAALLGLPAVEVEESI